MQHKILNNSNSYFHTISFTLLMKLFYLLINFTDSDPETRNSIIFIKIFILIKLPIYIQ